MTPFMIFAFGMVAAGILIFGGTIALAMLLPHRPARWTEKNDNS